MKALRFALLLVAVVAAGAVAKDALFDALWQRPQAGGVVVVPDTWLRRWDPVTVFFPDARGETGPEVRPERFVGMTPEHPGAFTWLDARTLQFRPAEPWPALTGYRISAGATEARLTTLMAPPIGSSPHDGETDLPPVESVRLTFAEPLPVEALARMITIELRELPGVGNSPRRLTEKDFRIKALQRARANSRAEYDLRLARPIPYGTRATLRLGLADAEFADEEAVSQITFATAAPFRVSSLGCPGAQVPVAPEGTRYPEDQPLRCHDGQGRVHVQFTAEPKGLGPVLGRDLVRMEPAVPGLNFRVSGDQLIIEGRFERERLYRVAVRPAPVHDAADRPLQMAGQSVAWIWFPPQERMLRLDAGQGIAERRGPKRVPVAGRGHARADLRVYRVDPENRSFWPFPDNAVVVNEAHRPPGPGEVPKPWTAPTHIGFADLQARLTALGSPGVSALVDLPLGPKASGARFGLDLTPYLDRISGAKAPGHYLVGLRTLDSQRRSWMRLQVTDLALSTVESEAGVRFVVTSLASGTPVQGASVRVEGGRGEKDARTWTVLAQGRTDANGAVDWAAPGEGSGRPAVQRLVVQKSDDILVLDALRPPDHFKRDYWSSGGGTWLQWAFANLEHRGEKPSVRAHLFTERPMYRPEHAVHVKGWLRRGHRGALTRVQGAGHLRIDGPGGAKWRLPVTLGAEGTFYAKFEENDRPTGVYTARFEDERGALHGQVSFELQAYRLPTFKVGLHGDLTVPMDRPFPVTAIADYYAGGRVAAESIRWRVTQFPYSWQPKAVPGFVYSVDGRYSRSGGFQSTPASTRHGATDNNGKAVLTLDPGIEPTAQPRTYVVQATITGADDQTVTAVKRINAVPAFAIGLKAPRYLETAKSIPVEILAVDPKGKPVIGQSLRVHLKHRQWHAHLQATDFSQGEARYVTDTVDVPVKTIEVLTTRDPLALELPIPRSGVFLIEVEGQDQLGRAQVVGVDLYAGGADPVSWPRPESGGFVVTPDKKAHAPGETAKLVLQSPFQEGRALVVIEAPTGNRYQWIRVRGGKGVVAVKLTRDMTPRLPVHVLLVRGRSAAPLPAGGSTVDLGRPDTAASTVMLTVTPVAHTVGVSLEHPERALPGQTIPMTVRLEDQRGRPVQGEVTLWLVDQAVLDLGEEQRLDPIPDFLAARPSYVSIRDTRRLAFGRIPYAEMPGGGDGDDESDPLAQATVRRDFRPVPYYEPALRVGRDGQVTVQVKLPDNLTRFAVRAKVIAGDRFGYAKGRLDVRLPVLAQPALPRFVRAGDVFSAGVIGRVVEGPVGAGTGRLTVEGGAIQGAADAKFVFGATKTARADFMVQVAGSGDALKVTAGVARTADGAADAAEIVLPVRPDRRPVTRRHLFALKPGEPVTLPGLGESARAGTVQRRAVVTAKPGILRAAGALDSLQHRPVGSTGERVARARAFLAARTLRKTLGLPLLDGVIDKAADQTVAWLEQSLDGDGRVAPFPGATGQVHLTAAAVLFVQEAIKAGYPVPPRLRTRMLETLRQALRSDYVGFVDGAAWLERTAALEALAAAGRLDEGYLDELVRRAGGLGPEAAARAVLAGHLGKKAAAVSALGSTLNEAILTELEDGQLMYSGLKGWGTDRDPIIRADEAAAMAVLARGLTVAAPEDPKLPLLEDALVRMADAGGWGNAVADAEALFALQALVEKGGGAALALTVGGQAVQVAADAAATRVELEGTGPLAAVLNTGSSATVAQWLRAIPEAPGSAEAATARGFVVSRSWGRVEEGKALAHEPLAAPSNTLTAKIGAVIEEHVRVVNPEDRVYVAIELPLAAGVEPLNPSLATAPPEASPSRPHTRAPDFVRVLDDRVVWYYLRLPKGSFDLYARTRAATVGTFVQPAAVAELLFDRATHGTSVGAAVVVSR